MTGLVSLAGVLAATALLAAGCSSGPGTAGTPPARPPAASPAASAAPADPVAILRQTGAKPDPGTVYGGHDIYGDRSASGTFPGGESVTVYTSATRADFDAEQARPPVDDSHGVVVVPGRLATVVVDAGGQPSGWGGPTPQQIAQRAGGTVLRPR